MSSSDVVTITSLGVAFVALVVSWFGIWRANRTTSAATLVTLNEGFRQAWARFFNGPQEERHYELAELLNLLEIACAIYLEKSLSGNARTLTFEYLRNILRLLIQDEYTNEHVGPLLQSTDTFIFIREFIKQKPSHLSVTIPPHWYQTTAR